MQNYNYIAIYLAIFSLLSGCRPSTDLQWHKEEGYRWSTLSPGYFGSTGFDQLSSSKTNITVENNVSDEQISENRHYLNGSGVATGDIDGDGLPDLYIARLNGPNKLYKNIGGLEFKDITEQAGVGLGSHTSTGVILSDVDGDSDLDLLVSSLKDQNALYINDGDGGFTRKNDSGLGESKGSTSMTLADIDGDGDLDLYITNYKIKAARDIFSARELSRRNTIKIEDGEYKVIPPFDEHYGIIQTEERPYRNEYGNEDELYIQIGNGVFEKVEEKELSDRFRDFNGAPKGLSRDWGITAKFQDINGDGHPDLYVCNDFWTPDRLWINQGDGTFKGIDQNAIRHFSFSSMGVDVSDINRDGLPDIVVTEMLSMSDRRRRQQFAEYLPSINGRPQYNKNSLYINRGDSTFAEIAYFSNLEASEWSWATHFMDIDLDGFEDLIIATGHGNDYLDLDTQMQANQRMAQNQAVQGILKYPTLELTNKIFQNNQDLTFSDRSLDWGFKQEDITHGLAFADFDRDGDLDIVANRFNEVAAVYENQSNAPRIAVRLEGKEPNTKGIGAKISLKGGPVQQEQEVVAGGDYLSGSEPLSVFAADEGNGDHAIIVDWPSGKKSTIDSVEANRIYMIQEPTEPLQEKVDIKYSLPQKPLFKDVSDRINHNHQVGEFDDFEIQPLLPKKLSYQGPGVSWIDIDQDGNDDLLIGGGSKPPTLYINKGKGHFEKNNFGIKEQDEYGPKTTMLGWSEGSNTNILMGNSNYEMMDSNIPSALRYIMGDNENKREGVEEIAGASATTGPIAAADYDGDGDLDFFIGGRFKAGSYPQNASSIFIKQDNGGLYRDESNSDVIGDIGLVTGAAFTDYDLDGDQDLLLSRAWDSIVLLENNNGVFKDVSSSVGLNELNGWWNGISTGDLNNDGRPDIVVSNIGLNSTYKADMDRPLRMYYLDFNYDGRQDIFEAHYSSENESYVPIRRLYEFGTLQPKFGAVKSNKEFAESSLVDILDIRPDEAPFKKINTLEHHVFINSPNGFEPQPLPDIAQWSAAFYVGVADYNNDGKEDLFISQNMFDVSNNRKRLDAGRGLWLKGDGKGNLYPVTGDVTGIKIYGQQRGAGLSDFNSDGKVDLAVSQNDSETKLYLNNVEEAGIRVQLVGPAINKSAIGSSIRLVYPNGSKGPRREIQAGSGYWSQNSTTQVMGRTETPNKIEITWFDGQTKSVDVFEDQDEYIIYY